MAAVDNQINGGPSFPDYDPCLQIEAVASCISTLKRESDDIWKKIKADEFGQGPDPGERYADGLCFLSYFEASRSLSAASSIAALFEGILKHEFAALESVAKELSLSRSHPRWQRQPGTFWNPSIAWDKKKKESEENLVRGVRQLAEALRIRSRLPSELFDRLEALYMYRNKMVHLGMEWPMNDRRNFIKYVQQKEWETWFKWSTSGDDPWIAFLSDSFIWGNLDIARKAVGSLEKVRAVWLKRASQNS